jgi:phosphatidylserine decarboxylase
MIAPEGWPFILIPLCAGIVAVAVRWPVLGVVLIALGLFGMFFFRNPERSCSAPADVLCSPADGKVIQICDPPGPLAEEGFAIQISVFMSVFDVHVNRAVMAGELVAYSYNPGRKISAFKDKASLLNEQNLSVWDGPAGRVAVKQIAGLIARRIVFDHRLGDRVARSDRIGLIRYGSRVDVFVPAGTEVLVALGDRVRAGDSPLARMPAPAEPETVDENPLPAPA